MNEVQSNIPTRVIFEETIRQIDAIINSPESDWSKLDDILEDLPKRLKLSVDNTDIPEGPMTTIQNWADQISKVPLEERKKYNRGFSFLHPMSSRKGDKNTLQIIYDKMYPQA